MDDSIQVISEWEMGHADRIAWRKAGRILGWEVCAWEVLDPAAEDRALIVQGGIPRLLTKGKYKGHKTWRDCRVTKVVVTDAEIATEKQAYTQHTGNCCSCMGKGEVFSSWNKDTGVKLRPCKPCSATGKPAEAA